MLKTSARFDKIFKGRHHYAEHKVSINGKEIGMDRLISIHSPAQLFDGAPGIGHAISRELDLQYLVDSAPPTSAEIKLYTRIRTDVTNIDPNVEEADISEWLPMGTFYIDSRSYDETSTILTLHCYDAMLKSEYRYLDKHGDAEDNKQSWPKASTDLMLKIAMDIGVGLSQSTLEHVDRYDVDYVGNATSRELLCQIAASAGGNFIIDNNGKLALVPLTMKASIAQDLGKNVVNLDRGVDSKPFTKVKLTNVKGDPSTIEVGSDSGLTIEASIPWGTQTMAHRILDVIDGWHYRPFDATEALLSPAVELGDTVMIDGWRSFVASMNRNFDKFCDAAISAPTDEELNHEYPVAYDGPVRDHELAVEDVKKDVDKVKKDVDNFAEDFDEFKKSIASLSSYRTTKLDFSAWEKGEFTETLEKSDDPTVTYKVKFDKAKRPTSIVCSDGHKITIKWG